MKVVRKVTYEAPDTPEGEAGLRKQLENSMPYLDQLPEGIQPFIARGKVHISIEHLEGPRFETDGKVQLDNLRDWKAEEDKRKKEREAMAQREVDAIEGEL